MAENKAPFFKEEWSSEKGVLIQFEPTLKKVRFMQRGNDQDAALFKAAAAFIDKEHFDIDDVSFNFDTEEGASLTLYGWSRK